MSDLPSIGRGKQVELHMIIKTQDEAGNRTLDVCTVFRGPVVFTWGGTWDECTGLHVYSRSIKQWTKREFLLLASKKISLTYYRFL
jgi:hypothetical protein